MKRRILSVLLILCLCLTLPIAAAAEEAAGSANVPRDPGYCGEDITWFVEDGTLTIIGDGEMDDFPEGAPWADYKEEITKVVFEGSVTYIGAYSFQNYDAITEVDFGSALYEIGKEAFYSCDGLKAIYLPSTFKIFGESCFQSCKNLTEIHSEGRFPSFRQNCLWDTYAKIYFPADRPWSVEYIQQLEEAFNGRIEFLASDGSDPYVPTEPETEPETQPETTVPPTTVPETQPPETTQATEPEPEETPAAPTIEETEAPAETTEPAPTVEVEIVEKSGSGWIIWAVICVALVLTLGVLVALLFRTRSRGGKFMD